MDVKNKCCSKGLLLVYQYFVDRGYSNSEITIINKYSKQMPDDDKEIVDGLYKIDVLIYSVRLEIETGSKLLLFDYWNQSIR